MDQIRVEGLSRRFCPRQPHALHYAMADMAREFLPWVGSEASLRPGEFWALRDVSFTLAKGQALAVMGRNGAGKSTLLRILLGTLKPTSGRAVLRGRIMALTVDLAFDPHLTGRENAFVVGALHGIGRPELASRLNDVIEFADLGDFFDAPVQCYSSGMRARLGFGVAMSLDPEVLLVDEALAVGDMGFQGRCVARIRRYVEQGGTMVLVSHSTHHAATTCSRLLLLDGGRVAFDGDIDQGIVRYLEGVGAGQEGEGARRPDAAPAQGGPEAEVAILDYGIEPLAQAGLMTGLPVRVRLRYRADGERPAAWGFSFVMPDLQRSVASAGRGLDEVFILARGTRELSCTIPRLPLAAGSWALRAAILDANRWPLARAGFDDPPVRFTVAPRASHLDQARQVTRDLVALDDVSFDDGNDAV